MISFTVRMRFDPKELDQIRANLEALTAASRQEPGCVNYVAHFLADDPTTALIYEQYVDQKALAAHRETEHFKKHAVGGLYQKMRERNVENLLALV